MQLVVLFDSLKIAVSCDYCVSLYELISIVIGVWFLVIIIIVV